MLKVEDQELTIRKLSTRALNTTKQLVKMPWNEVGVRVLDGETKEEPRTVKKKDIKAKGVVCGSIISSMYPQWVIT